MMHGKLLVYAFPVYEPVYERILLEPNAYKKLKKTNLS